MKKILLFLILLAVMPFASANIGDICSDTLFGIHLIACNPSAPCNNFHCGQAYSPVDAFFEFIGGILNSFKLSKLFCSVFGLLGGVCQLVVFPIILILLGAGLFYLIVLSVLPKILLSIPPFGLIVLIIGGILGFAFGSILDTFWWVLLIAIILLFTVFKK